MLNKNNQKGTTMLEALGAIAVIMVFGIASIRLIGNLFDMFKQHIVESQVKELQKNVSDRFAADGNYANLAFEGVTNRAQRLVDEKIVPRQMYANDKIYHLQGGEVKIEPYEHDDSFYLITFEKLSRKSCIGLSQIKWEVNGRSDLVSMTVGSKVFALPMIAKGADIGTFPISMDDITEHCSSNENTITWVFQ